MRIAILSNDVLLQKKIAETGFFQDVDIVSKLDEADHDVIAISDILVDHTELPEFKTQRAFYMLSNAYSESVLRKVISICDARNITYIPPKLSHDMIVNKITQVIFPEKFSDQKNIVTFLGTDSKVGCTMTALSVAEDLAAHTKAKVGLLLLNNTSSMNFFPSKNVSGLDTIKAKLFNNILTSNELVEACTKADELYILQGVQNLLDFRHYQPKHIELLLDLATEKFDIVLVDLSHSNNFDSGMAVASLEYAKMRILVTTQQESARKAYERVLMQLLKRLQYNEDDFYLVINKFLDSDTIYTSKQISEMYKTPVAATIPHLDYTGWQAEYDHKSLLHYDQTSYEEGVTQISRLIANSTHLEYLREEKVKEGFLKRFLKREGKA